MILTSRIQLADLCNELGLTGFAVEIGTDQAVYARQFLTRWKGYQLICVDPYEPYDEMTWDRSTDIAFAISNLSPFAVDGRVRLLKTAEHAAKIIRENGRQPEFVYIDGDHWKSGEDIAFWYPLLAPGGILAGHDYSQRYYPEIVSSVTSLCNRENLTLTLIQEPGGDSWFVRKP